MNPVRKRKLLTISAFLILLAVVTSLVLYALRQNISLFYTPTQVAEGKAPHERVIRLGGMVVKNSVVREAKGLGIEFKLTDYQQTITVNYQGILPDLFREQQGIVTLGKLIDNQHFLATEVLAKHDENYMPPEVKSALAASSGKKPL